MPTRFFENHFVTLCMIPAILCSCFALMHLTGCNRSKIDSSKYEAASDDSNSDTTDSEATSGTDSTTGKSKSNKETASKKKQSDETKASDDTGKAGTSGNVSDTGENKFDSSNAFATGDSEFSLGVAPSPEYEVPTTGTNDVLVFMQSMEKKMVEFQQNPDENREGLVQTNLAILRGMQALSNVPHLETELVQVRLGVMATLSQLEVPGANEEADAYTQKLMDSENRELADIGHIYAVRRLFAKVNDIEDDSPELDAFLDDLKKLASQRTDSRDVFKFIEDGAFGLFRIGRREAGIRALKIVIDGYEESTNSEVKISVAQMREHLIVIESEFDLARREYEKDPEKVDQLMVAIKDLLNSGEIKGVVLGQTLNQAIGIEVHHQHEQALEVFKAIKDAYQDHENSDLAKLAIDAADRGIIRNQLTGKKLVLEGNTLSGDRLDWDDFRGKVIIVYFWKTTSPISMQVLPELSELYERNRDLGIELIGVNLDEDLGLVIRKYAGRGPEWTFLFSSDINKTGLDSPIAVKCGIAQVPYSILIDQSGKVVSVAILGKSLEQQLANLLDHEIDGLAGPIKPESEDAEKSDEKSGEKSDGKSNKVASEKNSDDAQPEKETDTNEKLDDATVDENATKEKAADKKAAKEKAPDEKATEESPAAESNGS